ncbi:MAG: hypothetical protein U0W24_10030 [Bacteroidales bacterium]
MKTNHKLCLIIVVFLLPINLLFAQDKKKQNTNSFQPGLLTDTVFSGFEFRNIGPAFMSGRIADIAMHPQNNSTWYVAVGSGGVWKTENAGVTFKPIFDTQGSYSIGCVTIDPINPHTVWVGTGENVGGRHVGYGDGIYRSDDDGVSWKNLGLKESEHISKIIVHPSNSKVIWVAAQGPLWKKGGDRGLFKTVDGGKTWKKSLGDNEWTGVTDIVVDPSNPDIIYAATWQRARNVAIYLGGGPGSGIYKSLDGGETWEKLTNGLPASNMGKIGLAISPQNPDVVYAAIELDRRTGGVFRSANKGVSWEKRSDAVAGATGPHYYQELYASPHQFDKIYLVDIQIQVSTDGGKTFTRVKEDKKHSDNHTIVFKKDNPNYLLVGCDGGVYETFDNAETWRFMANLPVTQFYKIAVDDAFPFYNVYGGTQDNSTEGGPSRTTDMRGIMNYDWEIVLFADGYQPATEPGNPDIVYAEWQEGNLVRADRKTGELVFIQPQPGEGEPYERFNWDAPILVSPHKNTRIFYASQRVWQSEDRGDSWKSISGDLTRNQERFTLPVMDKTWSWDNAWDVVAMSNYNTITSLAESPKQEGLIYAGTDDGLIQVTEDGGKNWRKIEAGSLPGLPKTAFVNDIKADLFDAATVYIAFDNHKFGDFNPYLYKSTDKGKTWSNISGNLPKRTLVWRLVQDHVKPELLFAGTEFGIYFTVNSGGQWIKLDGKLPVISFRDLAIQRRENDLICGSFGRSIYILDDYSALREITNDQLKNEATLFKPRKAWWYIQKSSIGDDKGMMGNDLFLAPNPPFGAVFTYYLAKEYKTLKSERQEKEKELIKQNKDVSFPGWEKVENERLQIEPKLWLLVQDSAGNLLRRIEAPAGKGFHRIAWDLKRASNSPVSPSQSNFPDGSYGLMMPPGKYKALLVKQVEGKISVLSGPVEFEVELLQKGSLKGSDPQQVYAFWQEVEKVQNSAQSVGISLDNAFKRIKAMENVLNRANLVPGALDSQIYNVRRALQQLDIEFTGNKAKDAVGEKNNPTIYSRLSVAQMGINSSTYGPTPTHRKSLELAAKQLSVIKLKLDKLIKTEIPAIEKQLVQAGAPWIEGQEIP